MLAPLVGRGTAAVALHDKLNGSAADGIHPVLVCWLDLAAGPMYRVTVSDAWGYVLGAVVRGGCARI